MPYTTRTYDGIFTELKALYEGNESLIEGGFVTDVFSSNSIEFYKTELELAELYKQAFGDTATGEYLEMRAAEHGVTRRQATKSKGTVTVEGRGVVREGALFSTSANIRFIALETVEVDGVADVKVEAQIAGSIGNVAAGTITKIPLSISGIHSVTNAEPLTDGYDAEDDATFKERYLLKVRRPSTTGNPADYIHFCLSVEGVGAAAILRNPYGAGTVGIWLVDSNMNPADESLLQRVSEYIATVRPIGALVYIDSAQPITIDIAADIVGNIDIDRFKSSVTSYFRSLLLGYEPDYATVDRYEDVLDTTAGVVTRGKIGELILKSGADNYDYDSIRLAGNFADVPLKATQMPLLGTVTFRQTVVF